VGLLPGVKGLRETNEWPMRPNGQARVTNKGVSEGIARLNEMRAGR